MLKALVFAAALLAWTGSAAAEPPVFVTLGTNGGPVPNPIRSQPANALVFGQDVILLDTGDGTVGRLAASGLRLDQVRAVFLSHLHLDHTAGLQGVIGLHWMNAMAGPLRVYGPPGTHALVDGIVASMAPAREAGFGIPGGMGFQPIAVEVVELGTSEPFEVLPGLTVASVENSHYSFVPGSPEAERSKALSYRIDTAERSIVYTGDTGPSAAVTRLAQGVDLLVSEVQVLSAVEQEMRRVAPNMPAAQYEGIVDHLRRHHISPEDVGRMASEAGAGSVLLTHLVPANDPAQAQALYLDAIRSTYDGPVTIADDLSRY